MGAQPNAISQKNDFFYLFVAIGVICITHCQQRIFVRKNQSLYRQCSYCTAIMNRMSSYALQKRKFIMHSAHPTIGVSVALAARRFEFAVV